MFLAKVVVRGPGRRGVSSTVIAPRFANVQAWLALLLLLVMAPAAAQVAFSGISKVEAGFQHTCVLSSSGAVRCWGSNSSGQLGDTTTTNRTAGVPVSGLSSGVTAIAAGNPHACAVVNTDLKCWGSNGSGQLGDNSTTQRLTPVSVSGMAGNAASVAVSNNNHTCAVTLVGGAKCWGNNANGKLGDNTTTQRLTPVDVNGLTSGVAAITTGTSHSCALTTGGGVKCWGLNSNGQLGDNSTTQSLVPVDVNGLTNGVAAIEAGATHTCALTTGGGVKCWGNNGNGRLGDNSTTQRLTPVDVSGLTSGVIAIAAGASHSCALTSGGGVKCWGANSSAQLGDSTGVQRLTPVDVTGLTGGASAISANFDHSCAVVGGGVRCWGWNNASQLGDGSDNTRYTPVDVLGLSSGVTAMGLSLNGQTCAVVSGGAKCWGNNNTGQVGDGSTTQRLSAVDVSGLTSNVASVSTGHNHSCAVTSGGGAKCWGYNFNGQLGNNTTTQNLTAVDVNGLTSGVAAISAAIDFTCALTTGGGAKCWGANTNGKLGDNSGSQQLSPVNVSGLTSGVASVSAGLVHACALTTAGGAKCWGSNSMGMVGDNTTNNRATPVDVSGLTSGVAFLASGETHTCALTTGGGVKCWGDNTFGQLGDNTTTQRNAPVDVVGLTSGVTALAVGGWHNCALLSSGQMKCWGSNSNGELGDTTTTQRNTPVDVTGLSGTISSMAAGRNLTCVLIGGAMKCWGDNTNGQVGDGTLTNGKPYPVVAKTSVTASPPTGVSATINAHSIQATVSFTPTPATSNGGSTITGYVATSDPGANTANCATSPCVVAGLLFGTSYTFTVAAVNANGAGSASAASSSLTPATLPDAPTAVSATAGDAQATISFTAPSGNGSSIYSYTATANPGGKNSVGCTASPCTVTGLTNGAVYTFTVTATSAIGTSAASVASNSVMPSPTSIIAYTATTTTLFNSIPVLAQPGSTVVAGSAAAGAPLSFSNVGGNPVTLISGSNSITLVANSSDARVTLAAVGNMIVPQISAGSVSIAGGSGQILLSPGGSVLLTSSATSSITVVRQSSGSLSVTMVSGSVALPANVANGRTLALGEVANFDANGNLLGITVPPRPLTLSADSSQRFPGENLTVTVSGDTLVSCSSNGFGTFIISGNTASALANVVSAATPVIITCRGSTGGSGSITVTIEPFDTTPDAISFANQSVYPGSVVESNTVTITGINSTTPVSISGGEYRINRGEYTSADGGVTLGQNITLRLTAPSSFGATATAVLSVGSSSQSFSVSTLSLAPLTSASQLFSNAGVETVVGNGGIATVNSPAALTLNNTVPNGATVVVATPSPVTVVTASGTLQIQALTSNAVLQTQTVTQNGLTTPALGVASGEVKFTTSAPQVALCPVVGSGSSPLLISLTAAEVRCTRDGKQQVASVDSGSMEYRAANRSATLYTGETLRVDPSGELAAIKLGSLSGKDGIAGDPLPLSLPSSASTRLSVPRIDLPSTRLGAGETLLERLRSLLQDKYGVTISSISQDAKSGLVQAVSGQGAFSFMPVGDIKVDIAGAQQARAPRAGGLGSLQDIGTGQLATLSGQLGNLTLTLQAAMDPQELLQALQTIDANASYEIRPGGVYLARMSGQRYAVQPGALAQNGNSGAGIPGFANDAQGYPAFKTTAGRLHTLYPAFADLEKLPDLFRDVAPGVTVVHKGQGQAQATFGSTILALGPEYLVSETPFLRANTLWWLDGARILVNYTDGLMQGFVLK